MQHSFVQTASAGPHETPEKGKWQHLPTLGMQGTTSSRLHGASQSAPILYATKSVPSPLGSLQLCPISSLQVSLCTIARLLGERHLSTISRYQMVPT